MSTKEDDAHGSQASNEKVQDLCIQCIAQGFDECHHQSQNYQHNTQGSEVQLSL